MSDFYEIPDPKYNNGEFGTIQQPHLYKITLDCRTFKNSLNFHCKIEADLFIYRVRCVNRIIIFEIFDPIKKDFRHAHVRAGLILNEPAYEPAFMFKFAHSNENTLFFEDDQTSNLVPNSVQNPDFESEPDTDSEDIPMSSLLFRTDI